jgi:hypothetical protein
MFRCGFTENCYSGILLENCVAAMGHTVIPQLRMKGIAGVSQEVTALL